MNLEYVHVHEVVAHELNIRYLKYVANWNNRLQMTSQNDLLRGRPLKSPPSSKASYPKTRFPTCYGSIPKHSRDPYVLSHGNPKTWSELHFRITPIPSHRYEALIICCGTWYPLCYSSHIINVCRLFFTLEFDTIY